MALPTKEERIRRKKVMQAAGIGVPNTDSSWGPWWDEQWEKAITHVKTDDNYYGRPNIGNFIHKVWDDFTGNTTFEREPEPIGGTLQATDNSIGAQVKRTLNNWQHYGDPVRDITLLALPDPSKPIRAGITVVKVAPQLVKSVPKVVKATKKLFAGQVSKEAAKESIKEVGKETAKFIVKETPKFVSGYLGGKGVDEVSKAITGKSWAENSSNKMSSMMGFHIEPIFGDITNLGYSGGYYIGNKLYTPIYEQTLLPRMEGAFDYLKYLKNMRKDRAISYNSKKFAQTHDYIGSGTSKDRKLVQQAYENPYNIESGITVTKNTENGTVFLGNQDDYAMFEILPSSDMVAIPHLGNHSINEVARVMPRDRIMLAGAFEKSFPYGSYIGDGPYTPWAQVFRNNGLKSMFKKRPLLNPSAIEVNPYSYDSYKLLLQRGSKPGYELRYTGDMFTPNNYALKNIIDNSLPLEQQLIQVNNLIRNANPNAKLAKIVDGQIQLPHVWLVKVK